MLRSLLMPFAQQATAPVAAAYTRARLASDPGSFITREQALGLQHAQVYNQALDALNKAAMLESAQGQQDTFDLGGGLTGLFGLARLAMKFIPGLNVASLPLDIASAASTFAPMVASRLY